MFAFLVAARFIEGRDISRAAPRTAVAQLIGAASVAVLVTVAVLLVPTRRELDVARYETAAIIGLVGYVAARRAAKNRVRAILFAVGVVIVGFGVAGFKQWASGH